MTTTKCPYIHNEQCNRNCRGFECKHRDEIAVEPPEPNLTAGIPDGMTWTGRINTQTKEWQE
jgi:hypothetical protein